MKKTIIKIIVIVFMCGILYSTYNLFIWEKNTNKNRRINIETKRYIKKDTNKKNIDFKKLKEINKDVVGYIRVNGTNIDYVVVKGKDNKYYLNHNLKREYNIAGWIFADSNNKVDGFDKNLVIFGHNMRDGSMFGSLKQVLEKDWYTNNHNLDIVFATEKGEYQYKVFSTYTIKPEKFYITTNFKDENDFVKFINTLKERSVYDYNVTVNASDKVLTLSSCIGDGSNRVVLHAKKIKEG